MVDANKSLTRGRGRALTARLTRGAANMDHQQMRGVSYGASSSSMAVTRITGKRSRRRARGARSVDRRRSAESRGVRQSSRPLLAACSFRVQISLTMIVGSPPPGEFCKLEEFARADQRRLHVRTNNMRLGLGPALSTQTPPHTVRTVRAHK